MGYLTAKQFSEIWGITERRIIKLCKEHRISGAIKNGMDFTLNNNGEKVAKVIANQFSDTLVDDLAIMIDRYKESDALVAKSSPCE